MMKKNGWVFLLFIVLGLLAGTLVGRGLQNVSWLSLLTRSMPVSWSPAADLSVISYALTIQLDLSLFSLIGLALAIWLYRKV